MSQDYAKKGRPKSATNKTKKARASKAAKDESVVVTSKPIKIKMLFLILLAIFVVGGFSYFLYSIKANKTITTTAVSDVESAKPVDEKPLPPPPVEKWDYVETLKNKTINVEIPEKTDSGKRYQMQCGSFRSAQQAESLKAAIALNGFISNVRETKGSNGIWFRVVLGPYETKRKAESDKHRLQSAKINGCKIWGWT